MKKSAADMGRRIQTAREAAGLSREVLAVRLGATYSRICNWEHGAASPLSGGLPALCSALGVSSDWLLGLSDKGGPREPR